MDDGMNPTEWGWDLQGNQFVPLMMKNNVTVPHDVVH